MHISEFFALGIKPIADRFFAALPVQRCMWSVFALAAFFCSVQADAADAVQPDARVTLSEAIRRTFAGNPELRAFDYRLEAQQGRVVQAGLSPKPEVEFMLEDALGSGEFANLDQAQATLGISWVADRKLKGRRSDVAVSEKAQVEIERDIRRLDAAAQTARYFLAALSQQERMLIANRAVALAQSTIREIKNRVTAGKAPRAELLRAEASLAKRKLALLDLEYTLKSVLHQLAAQWGSTTLDFDAVTGSLATQPEVISFQALKAQIQQTPDFVRYLSLERVAEAELTLAEQERAPLWRFTTGIRRFESTQDYALLAGVSIPLGGHNHNQGRIAEVKANLAQYQSEADAQRVRIETSLFSFYQHLQRNLQLSDMLSTEVIPRLEQALTETQAAYVLGRYGYPEWRAVQHDVLDAQLELLDARLAAHLDYIEIERLTGMRLTTVFK